MAVTEQDIRTDLEYLKSLQDAVPVPESYDLTDEDLQLVDAYLTEDQRNMIQSELSRYKAVTDIRGKIVFKSLAGFYSILPELKRAVARGWKLGEKNIG